MPKSPGAEHELLQANEALALGQPSAPRGARPQRPRNSATRRPFPASATRPWRKASRHAGLL